MPHLGVARARDELVAEMRRARGTAPEGVSVRPTRPRSRTCSLHQPLMSNPTTKSTRWPQAVPQERYTEVCSC